MAAAAMPDAAARAAGPPALAWRLAIALAALGAALPLLVVEAPPLLDYPSHLTRMRVLVADEGDALRRIWAPDFAIIPNLAMDLVVPALARLMPVETATRFFTVVALLAPPLGVVALHRAASGRRAWWPLIAFALAYDGTFLAGFLNYRVGIGLAFLAGAVHWRLAAGGQAARFWLAAAVTPALFFCHLTAVATGLALMLAAEAGAMARAGRWAPGALARLVPAAALPAALLVLKPATADAAHAGLMGGVVTLFANPLERLRNLATAFWSYDPLLDLATVALVVAPLALAWRRGRLVRVPALLALAMGLLALFPLAPLGLLGGTWIDRRVAELATLTLIAACDPLIGAGAGARRAWLWAAAATGVARVGLVGLVFWQFAVRDLPELRRVAAPVEAGARVLVARAEPHGHPAFIWQRPRAWQIMVDVDATIHWPALVLGERGAFVPLVHTGRGRQPLAARPAYACLARPDGQPPHWPALTRLAPADLAAAPYLADWPARFDYVLVLQAGFLPAGPVAAALEPEPVAAERVARLYRVHAPAGGGRRDCLGAPRGTP